MKYSDFSSLVQLGVSLHLAMVAIQHYGDIGAGPLAHTIERIRGACASPGKRPSRELESEVDRLEADFKKFKLQMFAEFKEYWAINTATAVVLGGFLTLISWKADDALPQWLAIVFAALSVLPAPITLFALWRDATNAIRRSRLGQTTLKPARLLDLHQSAPQPSVAFVKTKRGRCECQRRVR